MLDKTTPTGPCPMCGKNPCICGKCPSRKILDVLCMINKVMHILVFFALTMVLFDLHGMLKAQKEYANAVSAAMAINAQNANSGAAALPTTQQ